MLVAASHQRLRLLRITARLSRQAVALDQAPPPSIATTKQRRYKATAANHAAAAPAPSISKSNSGAVPPTHVAAAADATTEPSPSPLLTLSHAPSSALLHFLPGGQVHLLAPALGIHHAFPFDHTWLRDVCPELGSSIQVGSGQKLFHTSDIAQPQRDWGLLDSATPPRLIADATTGETLLELTYSAEFPVLNAFSTTFSSTPPRPSGRPHVSRVPLSLLLNHASPQLYEDSHGGIGSQAHPWKMEELRHFPAVAQQSSVPSRGALDWSSEAEDLANGRPAVLSWGHLQHVSNGAQRVVETAWGQKVPLHVYARERLTAGLMRDGFAFVRGLPTRSGRGAGDAEHGVPALKDLAEGLGEIRNTFYGTLWDVISLGSSSNNIAYTNVDLGLHMDLCYFQNPPRFQFLHMLRNRVRGGESLFVDSYRVAQRLWDEDREAWKLLASVPVGFHYRNDSHYYRYTHPTFEVAAPSSGHWSAVPASSAPPHGGGASTPMPRLTAINYSPPFQSPFPLVSSPSTSAVGAPPAVSLSPVVRARFYAALARFAALCQEREYVYERWMREGECVVFDNRRVLHARRGFEWDDDAAGGEAGAGAGAEREREGDARVRRWLKGCYVDGDAVWSAYRVLKAQVRGGKLGGV